MPVNVTMKDIAKASNVSRSVVSFVLNGQADKHGIAAATRERILSVATELGYCRNELARAVTTGRNRLAAFVSDGSMGEHEYIARITSGVFDVLSEADYSLKIFYLKEGNIEQTILKLRESQVAGVICHSVTQAKLQYFQEQMRTFKIPAVTVNLSNRIFGVGIVSDDRDGIIQSVNYLCQCGHRRIAYIGSPSDIEYVINRRDGFLAGIAANKAEGKLFLFQGKDDWRNEVMNLSKELIQQGFQAVITETDNTAAVVMQYAAMNQIKVPEALSVTGFSNMSSAPFCMVPLTTVDQPLEEIGRVAATELLDWLGDEEPLKRFDCCRNRMLPVKLFIRDSVHNRNEIQV